MVLENEVERRELDVGVVDQTGTSIDEIVSTVPRTEAPSQRVSTDEPFHDSRNSPRPQVRFFSKLSNASRNNIILVI